MRLIALHQAAKTALRRTGFGDTALHIHLGLLVWLGFVGLAGGDAGSPWPLAGLLAVECANEVMDRIRKGTWRWRETIIDFVHTMFWPTIGCSLIHYGYIS